MVVCGDDGLAHRLAAELRGVYGEQVTLVVPAFARTTQPPGVGRVRDGSASLLDRMVSAAVGWGAGNGGNGGGVGSGSGSGSGAPAGNGRVSEVGGLERVLEAREPTEGVLFEAGVERAVALALVYDDDETNIRAALTARRLNPRLRLVLRLYNRRLGQHIEELLDQAAALAFAGGEGDGDDGSGGSSGDASTIVLSDADTAAPALAATAVAGTSKVVQTDEVLLRAVERPPGWVGRVSAGSGQPGLRTLALLSTTSSDPAGADGSEGSGSRGPRLLPDEAEVAEATGRGTVVLEQVSYAAGPPLPAGRAGVVPSFASLFSRRLRWSLAGIVACVFALVLTLWLVTEMNPLAAFYLTLLDLFGISDPAVGQSTGREVLQLLSGLAGLLLLPVLLAAVLEALGTFRTASALRKPPRGLGGHVVLLGLGKIGTRVLTRLRELHIPVVCVEADAEARGLATARRLGVPVVLGDVTQEGVLEAAKIHRAHALLAVTSADTTNLEAVLYARSVRPDLRVVLRLYDDDFATAVYRTLRAAHPRALTRSRSVTHLAAPAFAGAMLGRQILGAIPVERRVLLFAAVDVGGHAQLEGRTVDDAFRAGKWRVLALVGRPDVSLDHVLEAGDRVVVAATRRGLAELLGRRAPTQPSGSVG
ncbi:NAD-binding protein [Streptomyces sp. V3I7]|uniref:NAD-binding protein n=1 Tax=Streptomyces sp. V3I7 TaxID=3042278 RepID=UPI0027D90F00|nr:NAD-binding protein [Streptomyces sp. V3I7]